MKKLMIGEISTRFYIFENNTGHIKATKILKLMRKEFCEIFDKVKAEEFIQRHPKLTKIKNFNQTFEKHGWFKINEFKIGAVILTQDHDKPKGRRYQIKTVENDGYVCKEDMVPFIRFHANPQGILVIEKILFENIT